MKKFNVVANTVGDGYWSGVSKSVKLMAIDVAYVNEENSFGELRVYFDRRTWNTGVHGLIYTDSQFLRELRAALVASGYTSDAADDVEYSEQGMQGDDYVSCDVSDKFLNEWLKEGAMA